MLKRLKNVVQQQQEKSSSVPIGGTTSQNDSQNFNEGLMCPECRKTFETIDLLQSHYQSLHGIPSGVENGGGQPNVGKAVSDQNQAIPNSSAEKIDTDIHRSAERSASTISSFVCPQCFQELQSADSLQSHFMAMHANETGDNRDVDILAMRQEMNDLRATLKEEKRYAIELRKEVDKLHKIVEEASSKGVSSKPGVENESMFLMQQIQMLEAGKALVTTKMLDLEKQVAELTRSNESTIRERDRVMEKSLNMSREHASIQALYDEETGQRAARESRIAELKERVQDLEAELSQRPSDDDVAVLRKELIHAQMLMNDMAQEKERETAEWASKYTQSESTCNGQEVKMIDLQAQVDDVKEKNKAMTEDFHAKMAAGVARYQELELHVTKLGKTISEQSAMADRLNDNISALNVQLEELKRSNDGLKSELQSATSRESNLQLELERKVVEASETLRRMEELQNAVNRLTNEKDAILQSMTMDNSAEIAMGQLQAEKARLDSNLRDLENQFASFRNESMTENGRQKAELIEKNAMIDDLEKRFNAASNDISALAQDSANLKNEINHLMAELDVKTASAVSLQATLVELQQRLEEANRFETSAHESIVKLTKIREEFVEAELKWREEKTSLSATIDEWKQKCAFAEDQVKKSLLENESLSQKLTAVTADLDAGKKHITELLAVQTNLIRTRDDAATLHSQEKLTLEQTVKELSSAVEVEKARSRSLENTIDDLNSNVSQSKDAVATLVSEKTAALNDIVELREQLSKLADNEANLKKQLMEKTSEITNLSDEKQSDALVKDELADALKATEMQAADLRAQLAKVEDILRTTREETRALVREKQDELDKLSDELDEANAERREIVEQISADIENVKAENQHLHEQLDELKKHSEERDRIFEEALADKLQLEESLKNVTREKEQEISEKQKEINALLSERDMKVIELREARDSAQEVRNMFEQVQTSMTELESKCAQEKASIMERAIQLEKDLDESKREHRRLIDEYSHKESEFDQQLRSLTDSLSDMRTQLASRVTDLELESAKNKAMEHRLKELERQTGELQDEKKILLERCVQNEKYIEEEKDNCKEIQRRLDDAISAMYELGREHQSFQIDINRHYSRKWADDSEVHMCMKCTKPFSITNRKHHCRNCGMIFCNDCSSKSAFVGVSKKAVRVCDNCFNELQTR